MHAPHSSGKREATRARASSSLSPPCAGRCSFMTRRPHVLPLASLSSTLSHGGCGGRGGGTDDSDELPSGGSDGGLSSASALLGDDSDDDCCAGGGGSAPGGGCGASRASILLGDDSDDDCCAGGGGSAPGGGCGAGCSCGDAVGGEATAFLACVLVVTPADGCCCGCALVAGGSPIIDRKVAAAATKKSVAERSVLSFRASSHSPCLAPWDVRHCSSSSSAETGCRRLLG